LDLDLHNLKTESASLLLYGRYGQSPTLTEYDFTIGPGRQFVLARDGGEGADSLRSGTYFLAPVLTFSFGYLTSPSSVSAQAELVGSLAAGGVAIGSQRVVDAASMSPPNSTSFPLAPGSMITVFGTGIGPAAQMDREVTPDGYTVSTALGGVRVLVNGTPAPLLSASPSRIDAVLPYSTQPSYKVVPSCGLSSDGTVDLQVDNNGTLSNVVRLPYVYPAAISMFTVDGKGKGQAAAYNEDGTGNSADNPARRGSRMLVLLNVGGGLLPAVPDGQIMGDPPSAIAGTLFAQFDMSPYGYMNAEVESASGLPGWFSSIVQVTFRLPSDTPVGTVRAFRVVYYPEGRCPAVSSQEGVTVAVQP
jgi:uncharacterized protein (TIGR03437 family)